MTELERAADTTQAWIEARFGAETKVQIVKDSRGKWGFMLKGFTTWGDTLSEAIGKMGETKGI